MIPGPVTRDNSAILSYSMTLVGNTGQPSYQRMQSLIFRDHKGNFEFTVVMYYLDNAKEVTSPNQACR